MKTLLFHLLCVLMLMWPAIVNRQPLFFADTTSYVRAADSAIHILSGRKIATAWTDRYKDALNAPVGRAPAGTAAQPHAAPGNDLKNGQIMAGRSPYFGMLLWTGYILSDFWLFVAAQALTALLLISTALRLFGHRSRRTLGATVFLLSAVTSLPIHNSFLMADALAAFGILAFLLLVIDDGRMSVTQRWLLASLLLISTVSHLTHIVMILAMVCCLVLIVACRRVSLSAAGFPLLVGLIAVGAGLLSVSVTNAVVARQFGKSPMLVPLLTARFVGDGPGAAFIRSRCPAAGFAVCKFRDRLPSSSLDFLWSQDPGKGVFLIADPDTRAAMAAQDKAFAIAVVKAYPAAQAGMILRNSIEQLTLFNQPDLNYYCAPGTSCWDYIPAADRQRLKASLSGRNLWPADAIADIEYGAVALSLAVLLLWTLPLPWWQDDPVRRRQINLCLLLLAVAMIVNAVLGGAASQPQARYQSRIVWLIPFFAWLILLIHVPERPEGRRFFRRNGLAA